MSSEQTSPDFQLIELITLGYNAEIIEPLLIIRDIPYLKEDGDIDIGTLACVLVKETDKYIPKDHSFYFFGEKPYAALGVPLNICANESAAFDIPTVGIARYHLSSKPLSSAYQSLLEKVNRYAELLSNPAIYIDPRQTPRSFKLTRNTTSDSPFAYEDSASIRAGISNLNSVFYGKKIGIIGLGGTGSYILDLVSKTPVQEIHLFDNDQFSQHNAFRTPGAAAKEEVSGGFTKIDYLKSVYSKMHKGIILHFKKIDASDSDILVGLSFLFIAIDNGKSRKEISDMLFSLNIPFIDVGMGLELAGEQSLSGLCRVSFGTSDTIDLHKKTTPFIVDNNDIYKTNIQISDINALNAAFAVIMWKRYLGYYVDEQKEFMSTYTVDTHAIARVYRD